MIDRNAFLKLVDEVGLSDKRDALLAVSQPSIRLVLDTTEEEALPIGSSKFGGLPDLPPDVAWPEQDGRALDFVAQIQLADVVPEDFKSILPDAGMLYFFYKDRFEDTTPLKWWESSDWRVIFHDGNPAILRPATLPITSDSVHQYAPCSVSSVQERSLPDGFSHASRHKLDIGYHLFGPGADANGIFERYCKLQDAISPLEKNARKHRLLGYADLIQNDVFAEAEIIAEQQDSHVDWYEDPNSRVVNWLLLLQVDSDSAANMCWGDLGRLYYCIKHDDLLERRFDKIACVMQCT